MGGKLTAGAWALDGLDIESIRHDRTGVHSLGFRLAMYEHEQKGRQVGAAL
jgi:hypothetical protein